MTREQRKIFGTDGVRGLANAGAMTPAAILNLGIAAGRAFRNGAHRHRVVIGKDTRLSGYMIESALVAGFTSVGMDVVLVGPMPTPAVALLTRSMRADLGVMISASHNAFDDNGIKLFGPDGYKLSDDDELAIEALIESGPALADPAHIGRAKKIEDARGRYIYAAKATFPEPLRLDGIKVVLDCANGAAYNVAPTCLAELGADLVVLADEPNGFNINDKCGSTHPQALAARVIEAGAAIGLALDGDADRLIVVDEKGRAVDGDQIMAAVAASWAMRGRLLGGGIVATVMSNLGLERFLGAMNLHLHRTKVGDRYVLEAMRAGGYNVGGEQSGHIILSDFATTGDGLVAALQVLAVIVETDRPASAVCRQFEPLPQRLRNVRHRGVSPLDQPPVRRAVAEAEAALAGRGRLLIRRSGTEPLVRVMVEAEDEALMDRVVDELVGVIEAAIAHEAAA